MSGIPVSQIRSKVKENKEPVDKTGWSDIFNKDIKLFPVGLNDKQKESFYLELYTMIAAGVDLKGALELTEKEQAKEQHRTIIHNLKEMLINGESFSVAMKKSGHFSSYEYFSVQIGEETGMLKEVLGQLSIYFKDKLKQKRQFINALSYPMVILFTSLGAVGFMLYFIVPIFSDVFKRFGGELPYITTLIISFSHFLSSYAWVLLIATGSLMVFVYLNKQKVWFIKSSSLFINKIPLLGPIYKFMYLSRFCGSMALLVTARVPLIKALHMVRQMISYYPIESTLERIEKDIMDGNSLNSSLSKFNIYPRKMVALIKVGEEVGQVEVFFKKLSEQYGNDVTHKTGMLNTFLEPLMIIFLGIVIGFILIAMYLPMFHLSTSIGG